MCQGAVSETRGRSLMFAHGLDILIVGGRGSKLRTAQEHTGRREVEGGGLVRMYCLKGEGLRYDDVLHA